MSLNLLEYASRSWQSHFLCDLLKFGNIPVCIYVFLQMTQRLLFHSRHGGMCMSNIQD